MSSEKFAILVGLVYLAPHFPKRHGLLIGAFFLCLGVIDKLFLG